MNRIINPNPLKFSIAEAEFPAITICPNYEIAYKSDILNDYGISANDIRQLNFPKTKDQNLTSLEFFQKVSHSLTDIISKVTIRFKQKINKKYQLYTLYDPNVYNEVQNGSNVMYVPILDVQWMVQNHLPFGRCFTFHVPLWLQLMQVCNAGRKVNYDTKYHHSMKVHILEYHLYPNFIKGSTLYMTIVS